MSEDFYDGFADEGFDLIVLDEFRAQKTIQFMNSFVEGAPIYLRTKGGQTLKKKNLPVVVCSNYLPEQAYHNVQESNPEVIRAFNRRFELVEVYDNETLFDLINTFV